MKLLDEKGLTTVWATCKVKFALAGHTHNYAGSDSAGGPANMAKKADFATSATIADNSDKALSVVDCNRDKESIQMTATTTNGTNFSSIAGYGFIGNSTSLMGITKSALEKWLGLGTLAYSSESIPTKLSQLTNDKGFVAGSNVKYDQYHCFPICTDTNGVAYAKIDAISQYNGVVSSYEAKDGINYTTYNYNEIINKTGSSVSTLRFPSKTGTLALTSDIPNVPDVSDLCKANITYDISKCKEGSINIFVNNSSKDFSVDSIKDKYGVVVFAYVVGNCNITANVNMILYNNVPNFTGKVSVTPGMFLIIPNGNNISIFSF